MDNAQNQVKKDLRASLYSLVRSCVKNANRKLLRLCVSVQYVNMQQEKKNLSIYMKLDLMVEAYPFEYLRGTVWIVGEGNGNPLQYSCL